MNSEFNGVYEQIYGMEPPGNVTFGESDTDIIRPARGFIDGFDLTMQTQVGCPGGCLFCYVPSGKMLTPASMRGEQGEHWGFEVRAKRNVLSRFAAHLRKGDLADKRLYWSGVTDPYAVKPAETKGIWSLLGDAPAHLRPRRVVVQTRYRPDRDADLIARYFEATQPVDSGPPVVVSYSIGSDREDLIRAWERATPTYAQRMKAIETLRRAGLFVVPTLSPFSFWNDLPGTLEQFKAWDVTYITVLFFKKATDSANTPSLFLRYLEREYPLLLDPAWQHEQLALIQDIFGQERVLLYKDGFTSLTKPHELFPELVVR